MNIHLCACSDLHENQIIEVHTAEYNLEKCVGILRLVGCAGNSSGASGASAAWLPGVELSRWIQASPLSMSDLSPPFAEDWSDIRVWAQFLQLVGDSYAEADD